MPIETNVDRLYFSERVAEMLRIVEMGLSTLYLRAEVSMKRLAARQNPPERGSLGDVARINQIHATIPKVNDGSSRSDEIIDAECRVEQQFSAVGGKRVKNVQRLSMFVTPGLFEEMSQRIWTSYPPRHVLYEDRKSDARAQPIVYLPFGANPVRDKRVCVLDLG